MDLNLARSGAAVQLSARGSRGEQTSPSALGDDLDIESLKRFTSAVRSAAMRAKPLAADIIEKAQTLHRGILSPQTDPLRARLAEASGGPLLLRLSLPDPELQAVPWEASCKPGEALGFWASSPDLLPVRGVTTTEPWQPRVVRGALRILAIAPTGGSSLGVLKSALADPIKAGEIEWLDPVEGPAASATSLFERLRREPVPHVIHFLGHGGHENGIPTLRLADTDEGDESWLAVELLAQQLKANLRGFLRLIVLECCEGARPSAFASAAELLGRAGADAVVAHLWPIKADVARACSAQLYRSLAGADRGKGDIAVGINEARRAILAAFDGSAEAFSPVVYLRGPDGVLFDFKARKIVPLSASSSNKGASSGVDSALERLLSKPFSLLLGDRGREQRAAIAAFREKIHKDLARSSVPSEPSMSMSALTQRFVLHRGAAKLGAEFQRAFRGGAPPPPYIEVLSKTLGPGVHTTLLRYPWLEQAVAEQQPERTIWVIQPSDEETMILRREAHGDAWEEIDPPPQAIDVNEEIIILRPYSGYTPEQVFARPLLTEDDFIHKLSELESALPRDLANAVLSTLSYRPTLLVNISVNTIHHRMLLQRLYPRGVPRGSLAVIDPEDSERGLWERGAGLPGKGEGVEVFESSVEDIASALAGEEGT